MTMKWKMRKSRLKWGKKIYILLLSLLWWEVIINDDDDKVETHNPVGVIAFHTRGIKLNVSDG